jgi:3-hydroxyisobutyrate dehydrogenase-like beta-hydroxyacid dehydrogenase
MTNSAVNQDEKMTIGLVGLGSMGMPMLERLAGAGHDVVFFARRDEVVAAAATSGAVACDSVGDCASRSDVLFLCLRNDEQIADIALGPGGVLAVMRPGSTLLVHTTCTPETAALLAAAGAERGVGVADAPVDGIPNDVRDGTLMVYLGADDRSASVVRPLLEAYANAIVHIGGPGQGHRAKLLHIIMTGVHVRLVEEMAALGEELDLDARNVLTAISQTSASSTLLQYALAFADDPRDFAEAVRPFLSNDINAYNGYFEKAGLEGFPLVSALRAEARSWGNVVDDGEETGRLQEWERTTAST